MQRVQALLQSRREKGVHFVDLVRSNKNFRNPSIYEQLIDRMEIVETGKKLFETLVQWVLLTGLEMKSPYHFPSITHRNQLSA